MAPKWTIVSQPQATGQDDNGNFVRGRNVTWRDDKGSTGTVFIPNTGMSPDYVKAKVAADVAQVEAIAGLSSDD